MWPFAESRVEDLPILEGMVGKKMSVSLYLVDPDSRLFEGRSKFVSNKFKNSPECIQDVRKVLDNKDAWMSSPLPHQTTGTVSCRFGPAKLEKMSM